jgi:hypothetical protein
LRFMAGDLVGLIGEAQQLAVVDRLMNGGD